MGTLLAMLPLQDSGEDSRCCGVSPAGCAVGRRGDEERGPTLFKPHEHTRHHLLPSLWDPTYSSQQPLWAGDMHPSLQMGRLRCEERVSHTEGHVCQTSREKGQGWGSGRPRIHFQPFLGKSSRLSEMNVPHLTVTLTASSSPCGCGVRG